MIVPTNLSPAEQAAYEEWGFLFKADKTGTDKLNGLLHALYGVIVR